MSFLKTSNDELCVQNEDVFFRVSKMMMSNANFQEDTCSGPEQAAPAPRMQRGGVRLLRTLP